MSNLMADLMERISPALSKPLAPGVQVKTQRGYGLIVSEFPSPNRRFGHANPHLVIELEDGARFLARPADVQVVEQVTEDG